MIRELCAKHTKLNTSDVAILESMAGHLPAIAILTGNDVFIDALTRNNKDSVVLAWASPPDKSLYQKSVLGELALADSEPAVYKTIRSGKTSRDVRGTTQEGVPVSQTISAIRNQASQIIGVLIMEQDITKQVRQEERVAFLSQTAEEVSKAVEQIAASASDISVNEKNLNDKVIMIGDAVREINKIAQFVKNIADQTKMLGLNAAIEAARVGYAGRSFGVVAEEIKILSDESRKTTEQIRKMTAQIDDILTETLTSSNKALRACEEQAAATQEINANIEELSAMAEHLKSSSDEM